MAYARSGPVRIYWEEEGTGEPLLLIMGLSFSLAMWEGLRPFLAQHFRIILLDNRCVGKSDLPLRPFSIGDMAEDAIAVLDAAGVRSAHVFGISMGGMIAQELAVRRPERVNKLILGCTHCAGPKSVMADLRAMAPLALPFLSREARVRKHHPADLRLAHTSAAHRTGSQSDSQKPGQSDGISAANGRHPALEGSGKAGKDSGANLGHPRGDRPAGTS